MDEITNDCPDNLSVCWEVTSVCNYACWYCPEELHDGKFRWPPLAVALGFFGELAATRDSVHIDMVGGEPTLWPELHEFLLRKPGNVHVEVSSNGNRNVAWWSRHLPLLAGATLTFHPDRADVEHFVELCRELHQQDKELHIFIMAVRERLEKCQQLFDRLEASDFRISVSTKMLDARDRAGEAIAAQNADPQVTELLKRNRFNRRKHGRYPGKPNVAYWNGSRFDHLLAPLQQKNRFQGWLCSAGINRLLIRADGTIYRGSCRNGGPIGNIYSAPDLSGLVPAICAQPSCNCINEIMLQKVRA